MPDYGRAALSKANELAVNKTDKTYVDSELGKKATKEEVQNISKGSPKGVYATLSALQTAFPTGDNNIYLVNDDGKWYYWSGTAWVAGGVYMASLPSDFPATNIVNNGDFSNGTTGWTAQYGSAAVSSGEYTYTVTSLNASARIQQTTPSTVIGNVYYVYGMMLAKYANFYFRAGGVSVTIPSSDIVVGSYKRYSGRIVATAAGTTVEYHMPTNAGYAVGDTIKFKYLGFINLTTAFGAGNEPTLTEMDALMSKFPNSWFGGTVGQIKNLKDVDPDIKANKSKIATLEANVNTIVGVNAIAGEVVRPKNIPCVVGKTLNIHFDNILMNQQLSSVSSVSARNVSSFRDFAMISPTNLTTIASNVTAYLGTQPLVGNGTTNILPVDPNVGNGLTKKCLYIGDSITNDCRYLNELLNLFSTDPMKIQLIGTKTYENNALVKHEGHAGWAAEDYVTKTSYGTPAETNPFYNSSTSTFDFSNYMTVNGFSGVDYVFINLGTNDTLASRNYTNYDLIISYYNTMINSIKAYNPAIKILVGMTYLQTTLTTNQFSTRNVTLGFIKALKAQFEPRESEGIYLVPNYVNIDPKRDFDYTEVPMNSRTTDTVKLPNDVTHPGLSGHQHIADVNYSFIKYVASLG